MKNNSFILLKEEKERIKKLYEATTASSSGAFETPMGFSVPGLGGDVEVLDIETTFIDGDNVQDGSVEINLDIEDIEDFLNVSEEEDKKRMRKLHRDASSIIEQSTEVDLCLPCIEKSLGKYSNKAQKIYNTMEDIFKDGEVTETEFMVAMGKVLMELLNISYFDIPTIGLKLYKCKDDCQDKLGMS